MFVNFPTRFICFFAVILSLQCRKDEPFVPVYDVHPDFRILVDKFISEATQQGVVLSITNLILHYDSSLDMLVCGECNSLGDPDKVQKEIRVNPNARCWDHPQELEALIFHELGHCILQRPHLADTLPNGDPKSMMIEGDLTVYAPCKYVIDLPENCNNVHKRSYYIQELFDPDTPIPDWVK